MDIQVNGKQIDIGDALRTHVQDKLTDGVFKYFDRPVDAHVTFSREGPYFRADCSVHLSTGILLQAHHEAAEIYQSFDGAVERLEKRLRRYKRRLRDHHQSRKEPMPAFEAPAYVLDAGPQEPEAEEPADLQPVVVAESRERLRECTVGEAVMQLELSEAPVVVFRNSAHGRMNVVYRRADGNIGWVDPESGMSAPKTQAATAS